jgi:hypothetical protein
VVTSVAGFEKDRISVLESVVTCMAGFGPGSLFQPPGRLQIAACRLSADPGLLLNTPQRPTQPPQCDYLLPLRFAQDIAHANRG